MVREYVAPRVRWTRLTGHMHTISTAVQDVSAEQVRLAVADFLQISPERIDPGTSLTAYGIDSLGALELVASLEDRFERTLPESLLTDCPTWNGSCRPSHTPAAQALTMTCARRQCRARFSIACWPTVVCRTM